MKSLMMVALMLAVATAFVGCKKEETAGQKLDKGIQKTQEAAQKTGAAVKQGAEKTAAAVKEGTQKAVDATKKAGDDLSKKVKEATK